MHEVHESAAFHGCRGGHGCRHPESPNRKLDSSGYSSAPSARADAAIAYDAATHSTVLFGGNDGRSVYGDTWTWDVTWNAMLPVTSPSPRQGPAMAFDGAAGNVVLFGGSSFPFATGTAYGDTWTWDGINWTEQFPPVSPSPRLWSTMVYDPKDKTVLLFGGSNTSGGDDAFSDTWAWNGVSKTWTGLHPTSHRPGEQPISWFTMRQTGLLSSLAV